MVGFTKDSNKPVVFIGAAGQMCRLAIERFAVARKDALILTDINKQPLEEIAAKLPAGQATTQELDLYDSDALARLVKGAGLVVLGAGPYSKTSMPVLLACIEAKVPYLDFDDDVESTQAAMDLSAEANKAGVPCYIGCGASPGMSNIMAVDVASKLDVVDEIDLCWLVGDERPLTGKAVLHHLLHIAAGPCLTWAGGKPTVNETWVETGYAAILKSRETLLHETAHPEPVTLPRLFPDATRIRCLGGLDPAPMNGIARGLGKAVRNQQVAIDDAVDFLYQLITGTPAAASWSETLSSLTQHFRGGDITVNELFQLVGHAGTVAGPWKHALLGMLEQIWSGECSTSEVLGFLISSARGQTIENKGGLLVRAVGRVNCRPAVVSKRTAKTGKDSYLFKSMGTVTGTACAAFMTLALDDGSSENSGVMNPEDWVKPQAFYDALLRVGVPVDELPETLCA